MTQNTANPFLPLDSFATVGKPRMELAAERLVAHMHEQNLLEESHVLHVQMVLDLARVCGLSADKGRASGVAMASKELREILAMLPAAATNDIMAELAAEMEQL